MNRFEVFYVMKELIIVKLKLSDRTVEISADQDHQYVEYNCAEDVADLDLTQGTSFRFFTTIEENNDSIENSNCAAQEIQSYLAPTNNNLEASNQERHLIVPQQESRKELEPIIATELSTNVCRKDDFVSTSLFVCGNLNPHEFLIEQRKKATNLVDCGNKVAEEQIAMHPLYDRKEDQGQGTSWVQGSTDDDNRMENSQLDLPISTMPTTVIYHDEKQGHGMSWVKESTHDSKNMETTELDLPVSIMPIMPTTEELARRNVEKRRSDEVRKPFLKIQKSDFLSQKIAKELEEFTMKSSFGCFISKPVEGSVDSWINRGGGTGEAKSDLEKNGKKGWSATMNSVTPHRLVEKSGLTMEERRITMKAWHPEEKLRVLRTITNTMFLWDVEQGINQQQHYGNWPNSELTISAAHAAKGSQQELFKFLETIDRRMSRPLICCGAVCELLKAYPPERLLPFRFLEDFVASESREANDQCMNGRLVEGPSFDHLEEYQEGESTKFWQTLVHHVVSVKDHNLASLRQIAKVFVEILLASTRMEGFPEEKARALQQELQEFLVSGFKSKALHFFHANQEEDECNTAKKRLQHISKDLEGKHGSIGKHTPEIQSPLQQAMGFPKGYKLRRPTHLRPVSTRKGLLSCFGSKVQTNFRIWRLKALTRGVDTVDDALIGLLG
ncbi:unnamed protein product [Calypogeia fissa]